MTPTASKPAAATDTGKKRRPRKPKSNQPDFALAEELERILGVNATLIDGIDGMTIQTVLAEVGPDLSAWKTEAQWSSWLNLALERSESYLGARYRYLRAQLGGRKAVKAMARVLACLHYRLVTKGQLWVDRGTAEFEQRRQQRDLATLQRKARSLGLQLVPAA